MSAPSFPRSPSLHTEAAGPAPDAFGSFRVLHQIGAGTLGPVFRGYDAARERLVAIKLFKLDLTPERVHVFVAALEELIAADVSHTGLAAPVATGITDVSAFLATEYVAGESLDLVVRERGAAPPARVLRVATTLAGALDAAAAAGIVHGAMHPRDVLLSDDEVRVTGIGVARALQQIGISAPVRRPYTAPERIAGADWDRRADVFSLAALTFELLWGHRIAGTGYRATDDLGEVEGASLAALKRLFARALDAKPTSRFQTASQFAEALTAAFPGAKAGVAAAAKRRPPRREIEPRLPLDTLEAPADSHSDFHLDEADLRAAEDERFTDVEVAPALVRGDADRSFVDHADDRDQLDRFDTMPSTPEAPVGPPPGLITAAPDSLTVLDRSRSAVWPLLLALMLGMVLGFAAGFGFRVGVPDTSRTTAAPAAPSGREFTEGTVPDVQPAVSASAAAKREAATAPALPRPDLIGHLVIRSTPAGARVFLDDRDVGRAPAAVRDVAVGAHRVRVTHDGYTPEERSVMITRRRPTQSLTVALKRSAPAVRNAKAVAAIPRTSAGVAGVLVVDSRPAGARVFLDGKLAGTTPMSIPSVSAGDHTIRLERDGYRRWSSAVKIVGSGQNRVTASLER